MGFDRQLDDFEVAVFLTEASARHAILRKEKKVKSEKAGLGTKEGRLTGPGTRNVPLEIGDDGRADYIRDESPEENEIDFTDIPAALDDGRNRESSRESGGDKQGLFLHDGSQAEDSRSLREDTTLPLMDDGGEDDKKMALNTTYDGFWIYGRILCLVVKRRGEAAGKELAGGAGQAMMEEWIASTQMGEDQMMGD